VNAVPACEPDPDLEPTTPAFRPRRDEDPHANLTFYWGEGLTANGPYPGFEAADEAAGGSCVPITRPPPTHWPSRHQARTRSRPSTK